MSKSDRSKENLLQSSFHIMRGLHGVIRYVCENFNSSNTKKAVQSLNSLNQLLSVNSSLAGKPPLVQSKDSIDKSVVKDKLSLSELQNQKKLEPTENDSEWCSIVNEYRSNDFKSSLADTTGKPNLSDNKEASPSLTNISKFDTTVKPTGSRVKNLDEYISLEASRSKALNSDASMGSKYNSRVTDYKSPFASTNQLIRSKSDNLLASRPKPSLPVNRSFTNVPGGTGHSYNITDRLNSLSATKSHNPYSSRPTSSGFQTKMNNQDSLAVDIELMLDDNGHRDSGSNGLTTSRYQSGTARAGGSTLRSTDLRTPGVETSLSKSHYQPNTTRNITSSMMPTLHTSDLRSTGPKPSDSFMPRYNNFDSAKSGKSTLPPTQRYNTYDSSQSVRNPYQSKYSTDLKTTSASKPYDYKSGGPFNSITTSIPTNIPPPRQDKEMHQKFVNGMRNTWGLNTQGETLSAKGLAPNAHSTPLAPPIKLPKPVTHNLEKSYLSDQMKENQCCDVIGVDSTPVQRGYNYKNNIDRSGESSRPPSSFTRVTSMPQSRMASDKFGAGNLSFEGKPSGGYNSGYNGRPKSNVLSMTSSPPDRATMKQQHENKYVVTVRHPPRSPVPTKIQMKFDDFDHLKGTSEVTKTFYRDYSATPAQALYSSGSSGIANAPMANREPTSRAAGISPYSNTTYGGSQSKSYNGRHDRYNVNDDTPEPRYGVPLSNSDSLSSKLLSPQLEWREMKSQTVPVAAAPIYGTAETYGGRTTGKSYCCSPNIDRTKPMWELPSPSEERSALPFSALSPRSSGNKAVASGNRPLYLIPGMESLSPARGLPTPSRHDPNNVQQSYMTSYKPTANYDNYYSTTMPANRDQFSRQRTMSAAGYSTTPHDSRPSDYHTITIKSPVRMTPVNLTIRSPPRMMNSNVNSYGSRQRSNSNEKLLSGYSHRNRYARMNNEQICERLTQNLSQKHNFSKYVKPAVKPAWSANVREESRLNQYRKHEVRDVG